MGATRRFRLLVKDGLQATRRALGAAREAVFLAGADGHPQAGAIPYRRQRRRDGGGLEVLLVTSRRSGAWIVPKGNLQPGKSPAGSAAAEAMEEGGVVGEISVDAVGTFRYRKGGAVHSVAVFDLAVAEELADWPERGQRRREWVPVDRAAEKVRNTALAELIRRLPERIDATTATSAAAPAKRSGPRRRTGG